MDDLSGGGGRFDLVRRRATVGRRGAQQISALLVRRTGRRSSPTSIAPPGLPGTMMALFSCQNISTTEVPAPRDSVWAVLRDPQILAEIAPMVRAIDSADDLWTWHLRGISVLGTSITPTLTERMAFEAPSEIRFRHQPPDGRPERAAADGVITLIDLGDRRTLVSIDLTLRVELPLPRASRRAVQAAGGAIMQHAGKGFAADLCDRVNPDPTGGRVS